MKTYAYILAWGTLLRYQHSYLLEQVKRAIAEDAPDNAIYKAGTRWYTVNDVASDVLRQEIHEFAKTFNQSN